MGSLEVDEVTLGLFSMGSGNKDSDKQSFDLGLCRWSWDSLCPMVVTKLSEQLTKTWESLV